MQPLFMGNTIDSQESELITAIVLIRHSKFAIRHSTIVLGTCACSTGDILLK